MRFLLDENLPRSAARILRDAGHEVVAVVESAMRGLN
jgi:predicted nuclease of predicted toxin-antitoxin system